MFKKTSFFKSSNMLFLKIVALKIRKVCLHLITSCKICMCLSEVIKKSLNTFVGRYAHGSAFALLTCWFEFETQLPYDISKKKLPEILLEWPQAKRKLSHSQHGSLFNCCEQNQDGSLFNRRTAVFSIAVNRIRMVAFSIAGRQSIRALWLESELQSFNQFFC